MSVVWKVAQSLLKEGRRRRKAKFLDDLPGTDPRQQDRRGSALQDSTQSVEPSRQLRGLQPMMQSGLTRGHASLLRIRGMAGSLAGYSLSQRGADGLVRSHRSLHLRAVIADHRC